VKYETEFGILERSIINYVRDSLGFRDLRLFGSGEDVLPIHISEFVKIFICPNLEQNYSTLEMMGPITMYNSRHGNPNFGHVGGPLPHSTIRLKDCPEKGYYHTDKYPRGEILVKMNAASFIGYYGNPEESKKFATTEVEESVWFHTGDIGRINPDGTLSLIGSKNHILKIKGCYVTLTAMESGFIKLFPIKQVWVYGNNTKNKLMAVIVPDAEWLLRTLEDEGWWNFSTSSAEDLTESERLWLKKLCEEHHDCIKEKIMNCMQEVQTTIPVTDIICEYGINENLEGFYAANGLSTSSGSLRRKNLISKYREQLKELYRINGESNLLKK